MLERDYRQFPDVVTMDLFPPDEFSEDEARTLCALCETIQKEGYAALASQCKRSQGVRNAIQLAAGYGMFAKAGVGDSYLGVFIAAEMLMEPDATSSFLPGMLRSEVFLAAKERVQGASEVLMEVAALVRRIREEQAGGTSDA